MKLPEDPKDFLELPAEERLRLVEGTLAEEFDAGYEKYMSDAGFSDEQKEIARKFRPGDKLSFTHPDTGEVRDLWVIGVDRCPDTLKATVLASCINPAVNFEEAILPTNHYVIPRLIADALKKRGE